MDTHELLKYLMAFAAFVLGYLLKTKDKQMAELKAATEKELEIMGEALAKISEKTEKNISSIEVVKDRQINETRRFERFEMEIKAELHELRNAVSALPTKIVDMIDHPRRRQTDLDTQSL